MSDCGDGADRTPAALLFFEGVNFMARYVCIGTCGGSVSEEEFRKAKNKCGAQECEKYGEPLVRED